MEQKVAVTYGAEGAGNAIRMLAIADHLEDDGFDVVTAGGGFGSKFLEMNGFEPADIPAVDFLAERQDSVLRGLLTQVPVAAKRFWGFYTWIRDESPDAVVTDDPLCAIPATIQGVPFFRADHARLDAFSAPVERLMYRIYNRYSLDMGEAFYHTCLWADDYEGDHVVPVDPIVHTTAENEPVDPFDVLVIPGTYSEGFDELIEDLRSDGYEVVVVGGEDWEPVPAMLPYAQAASVVICTGFSSIAEAAVAGTPCVVHPFLDCQHGIAEQIEDHDVTGIEVVRSIEDTKAATTRFIEQDGPAPSFDNGAPAVSEHIQEFFKQD